MLKVIITKIFIIITKRVTKNIDEIIVQKCKVFDNSYSSPDKEIMALSQEIECLKKSLDSYRSDLKTVKDTSHNILGSIAYVQGRIKAGADGAAAPAHNQKTGPPLF